MFNSYVTSYQRVTADIDRILLVNHLAVNQQKKPGIRRGWKISFYSILVIFRIQLLIYQRVIDIDIDGMYP